MGAPFYFHRQQETGGAVYIYMNAGGWFDSGASVVLKGPVGSAFGMCVVAAGDLNQDGFQGETGWQQLTYLMCQGNKLLTYLLCLSK